MAAACLQSSGAPVQWQQSNGPNGHWYELVAPGKSVTWVEARDAARARGGYLATITSSGEQSFIVDTILPTVPSGGPVDYNTWGWWLGANRPANAAWQWVSGEGFSYTAWAGGQPDSPSTETAWLAIFSYDAVPFGFEFGKWDDVLPDAEWLFHGYIVEYDDVAPAIVTPPASQSVYQGATLELSVIAAGKPPLSYQWQFNGQNIAGATDRVFKRPSFGFGQNGNYQVVVSNSKGSITSSAAAVSSQLLPTIAGPILSPVNGHNYLLLDASSWPAAETAAVRLGGHLMTIRNQGEQDWVFNTFGNYGGEARNLWLGLYDPDPLNNAPDSASRLNEFIWTSGEPVIFSNWNAGEPNNTSPGEFFAHIWLPGFAVSGFWNDNAEAPSGFPWNGVVELPRPLIQCPGDLQVRCDRTDISLTGIPIVISSCSPADQVRFEHSDFFDSFNEVILRTWKAIDPLCGESDTCTQRIALTPPFLTTSLVNQQSYDGFVTEFFLNLNTSGTITSTRWTFNGRELNASEDGVLLETTYLRIDFSLFEGGAFNPDSNYNVEFSGSLRFSDSCFGGFGGQPGGGLSPPLYTLSRGAPATVESTAQTSSNPELSSSCGTFSSSSRWFRFQPDADGLASVSVGPAGLSPRIAVLTAGSSLLQPNVEQCARGQLFFQAKKNKVYAVVVDAGAGFRLEAQLVDRTRLISLSGNLSFGNAQVGSSPTAVLTIGNNGNSPLTVNSLDYPGGFSGDWTGGTIEPGQSRNVTVTFAPSAAISYSGNVTVNSDASGGNNTIPASGTGTPVPMRIISLSGNLAFGNAQVGSSTTAAMTIGNNGNSPLTVNGLDYPGGFSGDWPGGTIGPGQSRNVTVTFAPSAAIGYSGNVTVNSDASGGSSTLPISGTGLKITPSISWPKPASITYGTALSAMQLNASSTVAGTFSYFPPVGTILNAGGNQVLRATFAPSDSANYNSLDAGVEIDVSQAALTVTAENKTNIYGAPLPELTVRFEGFVNGDGPASLTSPVVLATTATADSAPDSYPITASNAASPNYEIIFVPGVLTVREGPGARLTLAQQGNVLTIAWPANLGGFRLQESETITGEFRDVGTPNSNSYTITNSTGNHFFRLIK